MDAPVVLSAVRLTALLLVGIFAGGVAFSSTVFVPRLQGLPGPAYVRYWQALNLDLGARMPAFLLTCIALLLVTSALSATRGWAVVVPAVCAAVLLVGVVGLTLAKLEPLNRIADSWNPDSPPSDWAVTRDQWMRWHLARTSAAVLAFACLATSLSLD